MAAQRLLGWPRQVSVEARNIVLGVLKSHNEPMSTHELFEKAVKVPSRPRANGQPLTPSARYLKSVKPAPPHPNHPVRSLRYMYHASTSEETQLTHYDHTSTRQLFKTRDIGGSCSHARHQKSAYEARVDFRRSRTTHVCDVQGST